MKHFKDNLSKKLSGLYLPKFVFFLELLDKNYPGLCLRTLCEMSSKVTTERRKRRHSFVFIDNFESISHIVLVFPLLTLNRKNIGWSKSICPIWKISILFIFPDAWLNSMIFPNSLVSFLLYKRASNASYFYSIFPLHLQKMRTLANLFASISHVGRYFLGNRVELIHCELRSTN